MIGTTTPNRKTTPFTRSRSPSNNRRDENAGIVTAQQRPPKSREVSSRYLSTSSSSSTSNSSNSSTTVSNLSTPFRRFPSPSPARPRSSAGIVTGRESPVIKRAVSAERRRPGTPKARVAGEMSSAAKMLVNASRSLSVSFQGGSYAVPKARAASPSPSVSVTPSLRRGTPERRRNVGTPWKSGENTRPSDQPWPGRVVSMSRSVDLGCERKKLITSGSDKVVRALKESLISDQNSSRTSYSPRKTANNLGLESRISDQIAGRVSSDSSTLRKSANSLGLESRISDQIAGRASPDLSTLRKNGNNAGFGSLMSEQSSNKALSDLSMLRKRGSNVDADTESVSSGSHSGSQNGNSTSTMNSSGNSRSIGGGRSTNVAPRNLEEPSSLSKCGIEPVYSVGRTSSFKGTLTVPPKLNLPRKFATDSPIGSPRRAISSRGNSSPLRGNVRPAPESKMGLHRSYPSTMMGRMASPVRVRSAMCGTPSVLCNGTNVRTLKVGDNRLGDAHLLRLLHNRHLQWRFVNAKAEESLSIQHFLAERILYNACKATSDLCEAVSSKRQELQILRLKLKLVSILKRQVLHLEEWPLIDKDLCTSLSDATESLKASTLRLPLIDGATVDIHDLKYALCSAGDVMHSMASSICAVSQKSEEMNSLATEVASLSAKEHYFLNQCKDTSSILAAMQVKDCSLRAHILQLKRVLSSTMV